MSPKLSRILVSQFLEQLVVRKLAGLHCVQYNNIPSLTAELFFYLTDFFVGFPEHMSFDEFCRRYNALVPMDSIDGPKSAMSKKELVELVMFGHGVDKNSYRVGLSQTFFHAGILATMDRVVEEKMHGTMVLFQVSDIQ